MKLYDLRLRWKCPHCDKGIMQLRSAEKHLKRKHYDCFSCRLERMMVRAMQEGKGFVTPVGVKGHGVLPF